MKTLHHLLPLALLVVAAQLASAAAPSAINYQGRLTNAAGVPQPGSKAMSLKIYDAATSGTQLYSETMGSVTVDANGVYSFQFGAEGTSSTLVTETLATTDGTSLTYQKALSSTPVIAGTASVTDGTYNWNETTGNPGSLATATAIVMYGFVVDKTVTSGGSGYTSAPAVTITGNGSGATATATVSGGAVTAITITNAGSGYTSGATITIAAPPAPFVVNYTGGTITATYATAPAAAASVTATYRYSASGISGALASGSEQWLELSVDGVAQSPRQKVLAVPFALTAQIAKSAESATKLIQKTGLKTSIISVSKLYSLGPLQDIESSSNRSVFQLPLQYTVPPNSSQPTSWKVQRVLDTQNVSKINSLSVDVESNSISNNYPGVGTYTTQGRVKLSLVSYSVTGDRVVIADQTITASNGTILLSGPFLTSSQLNEYAIELEMGVFAIADSSAQAGAHFRAGAIQMNYDSK